MTEPSVTILAKCKRGHETLMFPEKCVDGSVVFSIGGSVQYVKVSFNWECPVCPKDDYKYKVEIF